MTAAWLHEFVCQCREAAVEHQRAARKLLELAERAENPPEGVRVEYGGHGIVRFVGPPEVRDAA